MIAALYVATGGCYFGLPDVDPWDATRDARLYAGPHPVVAHPPCERWGAYWHGGPRYPHTKKLGDDGGCFAAALTAVRAWGGVLEHPAGSRAWAAFNMKSPMASGWSRADTLGGWTCRVEQGHYGHRARKATWLYAAHVALPDLRWEPLRGETRQHADAAKAAARGRFQRPPKGISRQERRERREWLVAQSQANPTWCCPELMSKAERLATPPAFRDLLLSIARTARRSSEAA